MITSTSPAQTERAADPYRPRFPHTPNPQLFSKTAGTLSKQMAEKKFCVLMSLRQSWQGRQRRARVFCGIDGRAPERGDDDDREDPRD